MRLSPARIAEIFRRQDPPRLGPVYEAAIKAVRSEAPSVSRASQMYSEVLQRYLNALSTPEKWAIPLAMYHPDIFEMLDQHILFPEPHRHPLSHHPIGSGLSLPTSSGTVAIAQRLGLLTQHPKVWVPARDPTTGERSDVLGGWQVGMYFGDLLLFLRDAVGPYLVSWDVKAKVGDHGKPGPGTWAQRTSPRRISKAAARDQIYIEYMSELQIPIVRFAREQIPLGLASTLISLFRSHHHSVSLPAVLIAELIWDFSEALRNGVPPNNVIDRHERHGVDGLEAKRVLEQAIWHRKLRVDLFHPILMDQPLRPEIKDVLIAYAHCFRRPT